MNYSFANFLLPLLITFFSTKLAIPFLKIFFNAKPTERMHYFTKPTGEDNFCLYLLYFCVKRKSIYLSIFFTIIDGRPTR